MYRVTTTIDDDTGQQLWPEPKRYGGVDIGAYSVGGWLTMYEHANRICTREGIT